MRLRILVFLAAFSVLAFPLTVQAQPQQADKTAMALRLYSDGLYERARTLFEEAGSNSVTDGYVALCAIRLKSTDCVDLYEAYGSRYGQTPLSGKLDLYRGLNLFDEQQYADAESCFMHVSSSDIPAEKVTEFEFKRGYCDYARGKYPSAKRHFNVVESRPMSDFTAPARYAMGYMFYSEKNFSEALKWFTLSKSDPRFAELSDFYITDCKFMQKDYSYVIAKGAEQFETSSGERRIHLARILSESYLVTGDKAKARDFYTLVSNKSMTRSDYFYAGSVLYAVDDFEGAVANFTKMTDRTDSLGQIANYQLGNAYIRLRNKVSALDAFKAAAAAPYSAEICEDAHFNYAKLAFDLNKDTSGFMSYIKKYNTSRKGDQIYGYMAIMSLSDHDYEAAVAAYDHIDYLTDDMKANYIKAYYLRGEQLVTSGSWRAAIPCLKAAAYYLPAHDRLAQMSRYWVAEANYNTDSFEAAAKQYTELYNICALEGTDEGKLLPYNTAYCHYRSGDYAQAAKWFDTYLTESGKLFRKDALERRADCDFAQRDYVNAQLSYQKVIDEFYNVDDIYPYFQKALSCGLGGNAKGKAAILSRVMDAAPTAPLYNEAMYELGRSYMDINDNTSAIQAFSRLNASTTDKTFKARALIGLGMVYRNKSKYDDALNYYKKAVELLPGSEYSDDALLAIESIYQTRKQPEKYLEYVESNNLNAGQSDAEKERLYFSTAEQLFLAGNYLQAASSLQKYLDAYPSGEKKTEACFYMAESYKALGNKEKACTFYNKVLESSYNGSFTESALVSYADLTFSMERFQDAYATYSKLLGMARIEDNRTLAKVGMMRSAYRSREYENAIAACSQVRSTAKIGDDLRTESDYIKAKSCLALSRRVEAMNLFTALAAKPSTPEGAEATFILIQDAFDRADFDAVLNKVYEFSGKAGDQSYWLARAYIVLADAFVEKGSISQATATLESVKDGYTPTVAEDDIKSIVEARLSRIRNLSSK